MNQINESSDEILDYEALILLIIKTLYQIFISTDIHTSIFVILNKKIYSFLNKLNTNINSFLDKKESIASYLDTEYNDDLINYLIKKYNLEPSNHIVDLLYESMIMHDNEKKS